MRLALVVLLVLSSSAHASPEFAVGVSSPLSIATGFAYGLSGYLALDKHQALRLNLASFESDYVWEDEYDANLSGRKYDVSLSYVYYPRRVWDGFLIDLGVLGRVHHSVSIDYETDTANWKLASKTIAARTMIGWSWLFGRRVFVAVAVGTSFGYESGKVTYRMKEPRIIGEQVMFPESYVRIGGAF